MRKFSFFLFVLLLVLGVSLAFVIQNNSTLVQMRFLVWSFPQVSLGVLAIVLFMAGLVAMWLIALMIYISATFRNRRRLVDKEGLIRTLEKEKEELKASLESTKKEFEEKIRLLESRIRELENSQAEQKESPQTDQKTQ